MFEVISGHGREIPAVTEVALAQYRYRIFIEKLKWPLPVTDGLERDEFDTGDTLYVIAREANGDICGCGRLLPTSGPYLLGSKFAYLMGDTPLPQAADVWELSRFAITNTAESIEDASSAWDNTCKLMSGITRTAISHGAHRIIAFSGIGNERLLKRMGVSVHRIAPPQLIDGKPVIALWIDINTKTRNALGLEK